MDNFRRELVRTKAYRIPLAYDSFGEAERIAVMEVLASRRYTQGERVSEFERNLAAYIGVDHAIMVNSGSSANLIALTAMYYAGMWDPDLTYGPFRRGDEVVIPGLCWPTTLTPLLNLGLRPVFCDIEVDSFNLSVPALEKVRTERTRAVIAIPILGNPTGLGELQDHCRAEQIVLLEDACQSLGAQNGSGKKVGSYGLAASFSFYFSHHISTIEGGCVVTNSALLAELCRALRSHGWTRDLGDSMLAQVLPKFNESDHRFCFFLPGYNLRATEISAVLGNVQIKKLPGLLSRRQHIAHSRLRVLEPFGSDVTVPGANVREGHSWMAFPLLLNSRAERDGLRSIMEECGVETRPVVAGNIVRHPLARFLTTTNEGPNLTACDAVFQRGLMLGLNPTASDEDEEYLIEGLRTTFLHTRYRG